MINRGSKTGKALPVENAARDMTFGEVPQRIAELNDSQIRLTALIAELAADQVSGHSIFSFPWRESAESRKANLIKKLHESGIDPVLFDSLLTNEVNRRLKVSFGFAFLISSLAFTVASYAVVVCNSVYDWDIPTGAITALVIETPIQFIGLLYIIARNLFPPESIRDVRKQRVSRM